MFVATGVTSCHVRPPNVTRFHPVSCFGAFWSVATVLMSPSVTRCHVLARFGRRAGFGGPQMSPGVTRCHVLTGFGSSHRVRRPPNFTRCHPVSCFDGFWVVASGSIRSGSWVVGWDQPALRRRRPTSARNRPTGPCHHLRSLRTGYSCRNPLGLNTTC